MTSTTIDDLGAFLLAGRTRSPAAALTEAAEAERLGLRRVWLSERYDLKEAGALLGGVAARTATITVATGVVITTSRHPLLTAALGATMQAAYGHRFTLGLGRGFGEFLRGQNLAAAGYDAYADYIAILRRLWRGETVTYAGPAGRYEALKTIDPLDGPPPEIWSGIMGGPKAARVAAAVSDGVLLAPFLTPKAVQAAVANIRDERRRLGLDPGIRVCASVVTAPEFSEEETKLVCHARLVTYLQPPRFGDVYARLNGWDPKVVDRLRRHPQFQRLERGTADQDFHRSQLLGPAGLVPDAWVAEASAVGPIADCVATLEAYRDAGADELALYGSTPADNARLVAAWRAR
ncbi:MAG TPA: TIGR03857 family LLM class F420-dependent oxidoreductase [Acidimicrobiia bacterium]|nr:TIGR03857 family LLM class F420-dependent oxidoreductase [Acidimicrobiia bacterium]